MLTPTARTSAVGTPLGPAGVSPVTSTKVVEFAPTLPSKTRVGETGKNSPPAQNSQSVCASTGDCVLATPNDVTASSATALRRRMVVEIIVANRNSFVTVGCVGG